MSRAYICDKCGLISTEAETMRSIWLVNPEWFKEDAHTIELCRSCFEQFEDDFCANLKSEGGNV